MLKVKYNNWMKIIKIYTIRAAHKLLLSVEVISRYSQVRLGPGWVVAGATREQNIHWRKMRPGLGRSYYETARRNRAGYFNEIFSRLAIVDFKSLDWILGNRAQGRNEGVGVLALDRVVVSMSTFFPISTLAILYSHSIITQIYLELMNSIRLEEKIVSKSSK